MKRFLLFLIVMFITTQTYSHTNDNQSKQINLHLNKLNHKKPNSFVLGRSYGNTGAGLMGAGALFMIGGLTTSTEVYGFTDKDKSFLGNTARAAAIISGGLLMGAGIVISIGK